MTLRNILLHFEFSNKTLDLKCVTLSIISTWLSCVEMKRIRSLHFSHNTTCLTPSTPPPPHPTPPPKQKYCITFVFNVFWVLQLSQEKLETTLMQNLGDKQGALYLKRCGVGDHPLCPPFSNMAVTGRTKHPYYCVAQKNEKILGRVCQTIV